jgi:mannitol-1-/sugar-/sorbitol-6-phosphatase
MEKVEMVGARALLFDMDGVLLNSIPAVTRVWRQWAEEHGFDPTDTVRRAHGRPSLTTVRELLPAADHAAVNAEIERRELEDLAGIVPLPGARELVASLPAERWTIVTSSTRPLALARLQAAGLKPPAQLVTASDVQQGKPHPEPYLTAAGKLGFAAADCIVVEDVPAGVMAGKAAGARVIGIASGEDVAGLRVAGADWVVEDCRRIRFAAVRDGWMELEIG